MPACAYLPAKCGSAHTGDVLLVQQSRLWIVEGVARATTYAMAINVCSYP